MTLSQTIKFARQKTLMSQEMFAKELHVSVASINRWETGKSKPNLTAMKSLKAFCERNGLSYENIEHEWLGQSQEECNE